MIIIPECGGPGVHGRGRIIAVLPLSGGDQLVGAGFCREIYRERESSVQKLVHFVLGV